MSLRTCVKAVCAAGVLAMLEVEAYAQGQPKAPGSAVRESTMTLAQIVQKQQDTLSRLTPSTGEVVWREENLTTSGAVAAASVRALYFARDNSGSITLIQPWNERPPFPARGRVLNWSRVQAAALVTTDTVFTIKADGRSSAPIVMGVPYNPAVHGSNPLVSFHPGMVGEETISLNDLWDTSDRLATAPRLTEFVHRGSRYLRIDFANPKAPGDIVYYVVNPAKGYLTEEIGVVRSGRLRARRQMTIGQTANGNWLPARAVRVEYDAGGYPIRREIWYYWSFEAGKDLPSRAITFDAFGLPPGTGVAGERPSRSLLPPVAPPNP